VSSSSPPGLPLSIKHRKWETAQQSDLLQLILLTCIATEIPVNWWLGNFKQLHCYTQHSYFYRCSIMSCLFWGGKKRYYAVNKLYTYHRRMNSVTIVAVHNTKTTATNTKREQKKGWRN